MRQIIYGALVGLTLLLTSSVHARTIYFGSETEMVHLAYPGPYIFRFPSEVKTISNATKFEITPVSSDQPNYSMLSVRPRFATGVSEVAFILNDGSLIKARLAVVSKAIPEKTDSVYDFKSKDSLIAQGSGNQPGAGLSELELMKAMIRGDNVTGYEVKNLIRTITPGFKGVETKLVRIYTGNQFNGYVFELTNSTKDQRLLVNIQNLMLGDPNLALLSNVDSNVLEPAPSESSKTYLRIVAKPTSIYSQLILPVEVVEKRGDKQ